MPQTRFSPHRLLPLLLLAALAPAWCLPARLPAADAPLPSTLIELDGSSSLSPDGGELAYEWTQLSGPKVELSNPRSAKPYFRTGRPGVYEFALTVEANGVKSEPHLVRLEIERENLPPVARVPAEAFGQVGKPLTLDGGKSFDPDGGNITYRWRAVTEGLELPVSALGGPELVFEPSVDGVFEVELVVSDGEAVSLPAISRVTVRPRPKPPVAKVEVKTLKAAIPAPVAARGDLAAMSPPASPLAPPTSVAPPVSSVAPPASLAPPSGTASFLPPAPPSAASSRIAALKPPAPVPQSALSLPLPPAAPAPASPPAPVAPAVPASPIAPAAPSAALPPPVARVSGPVAAKAGDTVTLDARDSWGPSGSRLEYLWKQKSGAFINDFELVLDGAAQRFKAPRPGDYEFELTVVDAGRESVPVLHRLKVVEQEDPPVAVIVAPTRSMPGALVRMDATQSYDMAGSSLVYRWRQTGGPAVKNYVIDETLGDAAPAFHPPTAGVYSFELIVSNGRLASKPVEINIEVGSARVPPKFTVTGPEAATAGERLAWDIAIDGADARGYSFAWRQTEGPANAALQAQGMRSLIMAPIPGRYVFEVAMRDQEGRIVSASRRELEVFKGSRAAGAAVPLVLPPSPVQPAAPRQRRIVPEIAPLPNTPPVPPITSFPPPAPVRRQPAQILQR